LIDFSSIWRKLYVDKKSSLIIADNKMNEKSKPVIQFYLLAYGLSLMICGINVFISREQNIINKM
jgi:hypothetical protein